MSSAINPNSAVPLYKQIANVIAQDIKDGKYNYGDRLPSELTLKDTFGVSRITIRAAISELMEEGLLVRSQGKGTFIAQPKAIMPASDHPGFTQSCLLAGRTPSTKLLSIDYTYPSPAECLFLNLNETDKVIVSKRLRFIENYPTVIETNHYITDFDFLFNEDLNGSLSRFSQAMIFMCQKAGEHWRYARQQEPRQICSRLRQTHRCCFLRICRLTRTDVRFISPSMHRLPIES